MARTSRFGLTALGPGDPLGTDGGRFTYADRFVLDRLLAAAESHTHTGGTRLADPSAGPQLTLHDANGFLPAGATLYYRISYLDAFGLETAASPEVSIRTPDPPSPPVAPQLVVEGQPGTLDRGVYQYAVTAEINGFETAIGPPAMVTLDEPGAIGVRPLGLPAEATGYYVWRLPQDGMEFFRVTSTAVPVATSEYLDDGSVGYDFLATLDPSQAPPRGFQSSATNVVSVSVPDADVAKVAAGLRWRIYRTFVSGVYDADSLVAEVVTTVDETDPTSARVTLFYDYGDDKVAGTPLEISQTLTPSRRLRSTDIDHATTTVGAELVAQDGRLDAAEAQLADHVLQLSGHETRLDDHDAQLATLSTADSSADTRLDQLEAATGTGLVPQVTTLPTPAASRPVVFHTTERAFYVLADDSASYRKLGSSSAAPSRQTASVTLNGSGTVTLAPGYRLYAVTTSAAARVRLYVSPANRDADTDRAPGTDPSAAAGLMLDLVTTAAGTRSLSPLVDGYTADATASVPIRVDAAAATTVTLLYLPTEG